MNQARTTIQTDADRAKLNDEAADLFRKVIAWTDETQKIEGRASRHATQFRTVAELNELRVLQQQGKSDEVIAAAEQLGVKHRGTVEELIFMSVAYHAYKQKRQTDKAEGVRHTHERAVRQAQGQA